MWSSTQAALADRLVALRIPSEQPRGQGGAPHTRVVTVSEAASSLAAGDSAYTKSSAPEDPLGKLGGRGKTKAQADGKESVHAASCLAALCNRQSITALSATLYENRHIRLY